jgi:hypothetical protein
MTALTKNRNVLFVKELSNVLAATAAHDWTPLGAAKTETGHATLLPGRHYSLLLLFLLRNVIVVAQGFVGISRARSHQRTVWGLLLGRHLASLYKTVLLASGKAVVWQQASTAHLQSMDIVFKIEL